MHEVLPEPLGGSDPEPLGERTHLGRAEQAGGGHGPHLPGWPGTGTLPGVLRLRWLTLLTGDRDVRIGGVDFALRRNTVAS
ncbi:hypothetical protein GCM10023175_70420 [Pseudonocardia xishanensis]|uniref:Uncharacterized protein n=1 Tax=Pseudonocardia xishanensis TaxID=630995 RepID=A0ABP8S4R4_9PSEU